MQAATFCSNFFSMKRKLNHMTFPRRRSQESPVIAEVEKQEDENDEKSRRATRRDWYLHVDKSTTSIRSKTCVG